MDFRVLLLTINLFLLGLAGLFLGSQRPAGTAGQLLAFACILAQVLTITRMVRSRRERRRRTRILPAGTAVGELRNAPRSGRVGP